MDQPSRAISGDNERIMAIKGPYGFGGGYNSKASAFTNGKNQLSSGYDTQIIYGDLMQRGGSSAINASAISGTPAIHGLYDWYYNGNRYVIVTAGTKIKYSQNLGSTLSDITGSATITSGQTNLHTFASLNNILAICGGVTPDTPLQWTGTGNVSALPGSPPSGNLVTVANNFMFISGIASAPSQISWSNASDPTTWNAGSSLTFRQGDGDVITAISQQYQNVVIFKRFSIGTLWTQTQSTSGTVTLGPLVTNIIGMGCVGPLALDNMIDGMIVFLGSDAHVYIFDGVNIQDISDQAPPKTNVQNILDGCNINYLKYSCVKVYPTKNQIWISIPNGSSTSTNMILVYDYIQKIWNTPFTNINANVMEAAVDTRTTPHHPIVLLTGNYGGMVYEQDWGLTNAEVSTGVIGGTGTISVQLEAEEAEFTPRSAIVPYEAQTTGGNLEFDYGFNGYVDTPNQTFLSQSQLASELDASFQLDVTSLAGPSTLRAIQPLVTNGRVYSMQMTFRNTNSGQTFTAHPLYLSDEVAI